MVNVLHISTTINGGLSVLVNLHQNLMERGVNSKILYLYPTEKECKNLFSFPINNRTIIQRIANKLGFPIRRDDRNKKKLHGKNESISIFTLPQTDYDISSHYLIKEADIIHLHWVSNFLDYNFFSKINKPILWTFHDMNPFTGGCHYTGGCMKFTNDCEDCPQLSGCISSSYANESLLYKKSNLKKSNIGIIVLNNYMKRCSESSYLFHGHNHFLIPNSVDLKLFYEEDKAKSRKIFNLPLNKIVFGFSAFYRAKSKGADLLREAFDTVKKSYPDVILCNIGGEYEELKNAGVSYIGRIEDKNLLRSFYSSLDAFILPSRDDNLPSVMLESLACGRPIIGFDIGGLTDHIVDGSTGLLAKQITANALADKMIEFIKKPTHYSSQNIRQYAKEKFDSVNQVNAYINLYNNIYD